MRTQHSELGRVTALTVATLLGVCVSAGGAFSLDEFFAPPSIHGADYPSDRVFPQGRIFPLSFYSAGGGQEAGEDLEAGLARIRADGFTMLGPQYELNSRALADAAQNDLWAIYTIDCNPHTPDGLPSLAGPVAGRYTLAETAVVEENVRRQVEAVMHHPRLAWWYVTPEELRYWRGDEIRYLEIAADTIRRVDPLRRPVWMYDPGHRDAGALSYTARHLDILGKGCYTNYSGRKHARIWVRWTIEQQLQAIEAVGREVTPIVVPEMFQQPPEEELDLIESWVRHDVYLALLTGAKGIVVFSMRRRAKGVLQETPFDAHERYYQAYAQVARELTGPEPLGQVFLFGERREDLDVQIYRGPRWLSLRPPEEDLGERSGGSSRGEYRSVSFADIAYGPYRYLVAVNSAEEVVRVRLRGLPLGTVQVYDVFAGTPLSTVAGGQLSLDFAPLEAKFLRFARAE